MKHYFNFISSGHGRIEIEEPVSLDVAEFTFEQEQGRKGRDVYIVGNEKTLRIYSMPNHAFEIFKYNRDKFGFEANIKYEIEFNDVTRVIGDVTDTISDGATYIEFTVLEENERAILKRRMDVNTNLFSYRTLDDVAILPVPTHKVLIPAKPIVQVSEWNNTESGQILISGNSILPGFFNTLRNQLRSEINDSLSWTTNIASTFGGNFDSDYSSDPRDYKLLRATANTVNLSAVIQLNMKSEWTNINFPAGNLRVTGRIFKGPEFSSIADFRAAANEDSNIIFYDTGALGAGGVYEYNNTVTIPLPNLIRGEILYCVFKHNAQNDTQLSRNIIFNSKVTIKASSVTYNTVVPMVRLIDAMRYNVKSASGMDLFAPRWDFGGEFYDQFITTQALMRSLAGRPFNMNFKDIVSEYLQPEPNGDYQLMRNGTVFFGKERDFYRDMEVANFEQQYDDHGQIEGYEDSYNEKYSVNQINFSYKNYASKKENTTDNSYDLVHGKYSGLLPNTRVQNNKNLEVGWVRDAFSWEEARRKALDLSDSTATQDDDKIFIADIIALRPGLFYTETSLLRHSYDDTRHILTLRNDKSFSWELLGMAVGDRFFIDSSSNAATYTISQINNFTIELNATSGNNIDAENTTYSYGIGSDVEFKARTSENFVLIDNLNDGDSYMNLLYTVKRNVLNNYNSYLATCMMYHPDEFIKQTDYKNNIYCRTRLSTEPENIVEGANIKVSDPTLTPLLIKCKLIMTLEEFLYIENEIRSYDEYGVPKAGYIRTFDANGLPIKGYPQKMSWTFLSKGGDDVEDLVGVCDTLLEEKYIPFYMDIFGAGGGVITINSDITPNSFDYEIDAFGNLLIFDEVGKLLHVPVKYNRVRVNNSDAATSAIQLAEWLQGLQ